MNAVAVARGILLALAWLALAAIIAVGAAGVVASMNHRPGTPARAELTWAGDEAAGAALDAVDERLQQLSDAVDGLGTTARQALSDVVAGDLDALGTTITEGTAQVLAVRQQADALREALAAVPGVGPGRELRVSSDITDRYDALAATVDLTDGLEAEWAGFTGRALDAARLTGLLSGHDQETAAAAHEGSAGHYRRALTLLERSDATIAESRELRDRLARTTDVDTLGDWIDRNAAYDAALRDLYQSLLDANGRVTDRVRRAFQQEQAARSQLPADTRALVVIMADIAQGGLNQAVISIEQARGALGDALDRQRLFRASPSPAP